MLAVRQAGRTGDIGHVDEVPGILDHLHGQDRGVGVRAAADARRRLRGR